MSLASTHTIKNQLNNALGQKAPIYFDTLSQYVSGKISRTEFEDTVRQVLDASNLVQLHNSLIISLFDLTAHRRPPTPLPEAPKPPPRKRRRLLPYQGPDSSDDTLRSSRLKRWAVSVGKAERDRIKQLAISGPERPRPRMDTDEIARERGVVLMMERGEPPGSRLPLNLAQMSRAPTLQHISDRINLISAQHNLNAPNRTVSSLLMLAFEAKLKQLITHAITLTSTSHAITSITPSAPHSHARVLTASSFDTLFNISPAVLPNQSAAAMRLAIGDNEPVDEDEYRILKGKDTHDHRWQLLALLGEQRSTVRDALRNMR
ncbi:hypothetical protein CONPUDRAFT_107429 [Coniophora puteana RWD-64-598 SS2]|uniref:Transcriptional regulator of RNA polII, SAGA, subunit-domain-containing protein n=1 Tax=Coniophora puteana (strain RWD-64-598) TaxID=741705 RepID=A0A5M3MJ15_CONPW|nr:uncharacterized protein CONPUDRAFT_107429 [Coniophora puteana RWD-64-598 SS2]EIW79238.1 hypothetical protein CONPUDRAFT_107429 [Coniophora puteana RWD-64-598 SS2]